MEEYRAPAELLNEKGKLTRSGWSAQDDFIYNKENAGGGLTNAGAVANTVLQAAVNK